MARHVAGEIKVTEQLLRPASRQLHFTGDPIYEPPTFDKMLTELFIQPMIEDMRRDSNLLCFGGGGLSQPRHETQKLFAPTATCHQYLDVGDSWLTCHLDDGHADAHYDAHARVEWRSR